MAIRERHRAEVRLSVSLILDKIAKWRAGEDDMSLARERESWLDRWWLLFLILFGLIFVTFILAFKPMY